MYMCVVRNSFFVFSLFFFFFGFYRRYAGTQDKAMRTIWLSIYSIGSCRTKLYEPRRTFLLSPEHVQWSVWKSDVRERSVWTMSNYATTSTKYPREALGYVGVWLWVGAWERFMATQIVCTKVLSLGNCLLNVLLTKWNVVLQFW